MPKNSIDALAHAHGIALDYLDAAGTSIEASEAAKRGLLAALGVDIDGQQAPSPPSFQRDPTSADVRNRRAHMPPWLEDGRAWGVTCQLYSLNSARYGGIGDFEDLARLAELLGQRGADFIGVNPIHALFFADARRFSPYSPSSRRFLAPLYIATDLLPGAESEPPSATGGPSPAPLIDYERIWSRKIGCLQAAFAHFERHDLGRRTARDVDFERFRLMQGAELESFALFETISEYHAAQGLGAGWRGWPLELRRRDSGAVAIFKQAHERRVLFHAWLQWIAASQLADAQSRAKASGMRIGLYLDVAVGVAPDGADTWCAPNEVVASARIGAPPDAFNVLGQDWGLAPLSPRAIGQGNSGLFRAVVESASRYAGALRLDHATALTRLYLIPDGNETRDGAYVAYPLAELLDIVAEVSQTYEVIVVGEDLGTVPAGFRDALREREVQGYRVLIFERTDTGFLPPAVYERGALACIATHDLPTFAGWWRGQDIEDRAGLGILNDDLAASARDGRVAERRQLVALLEMEGLLATAARQTRLADEACRSVEEITVAVHRLLARTPCRLVAIQIEDLVGFAGAMNIPGTIDEHPNWRQRLSVKIDDLPRLPLFRQICDAMKEERPRTC